MGPGFRLQRAVAVAAGFGPPTPSVDLMRTWSVPRRASSLPDPDL